MAAEPEVVTPAPAVVDTQAAAPADEPAERLEDSARPVEPPPHELTLVYEINADEISRRTSSWNKTPRSGRKRGSSELRRLLRKLTAPHCPMREDSKSKVRRRPNQRTSMIPEPA